MVEIELTDTELVVHITGVDVVLALRSTFTVPLAHVVRAVARPPDAEYDKMKGLRVAGGYVPDAFAAGLFWVTGGPDDGAQEANDLLARTAEHLSTATDRYANARMLVEAARAEVGARLRDEKLPPTKKHWAFYDVHDPTRAIGIDLEQQKVSRIVVQVDDETPEEAVARIQAAIARVRG